MMVVLQNFGFFINLGASQLTKNPISIDKNEVLLDSNFWLPYTHLDSDRYNH